MMIAATILSAVVLCLVGVLFAISPGRPTPILDANGEAVPGSISEKVFVPINGSTQGMFVKSRNPANPVLLFVHGGPGMTGYFLNDEYPTGLEDEFTVAWWDQRGAGLSYRADIPTETMTVPQFIDDLLAVTNYLRDRFNVDKIYLLGHSWGSFIGIQSVAKAPQLYHAYVGMGQVTHQLESERRAYDYMLETARSRGTASSSANFKRRRSR